MFLFLLVQEAAEVVRSRRMAKLAQRFRLDLTDTLSGHVKLLPDSLERVVSVHIDTETHPENLCFTRCEAAKYFSRRLGQAFFCG